MERSDEWRRRSRAGTHFLLSGLGEGADQRSYLWVARAIMTSMSTSSLLSVGYEGRDVEELIAELTSSDVSVLIDVRLTPLSRKPGMSKRKLAARLETEGISYVHAKALGNPKDNRAASGPGSKQVLNSSSDSSTQTTPKRPFDISQNSWMAAWSPCSASNETTKPATAGSSPRPSHANSPTSSS